MGADDIAAGDGVIPVADADEMPLRIAVGEGFEEWNLVVGAEAFQPAGHADAGARVVHEVRAPVSGVGHGIQGFAVEGKEGIVHGEHRIQRGGGAVVRFIADADAVHRRRGRPAALGAEAAGEGPVAGLAHQIREIHLHPAAADFIPVEVVGLGVAHLGDAVEGGDFKKFGGEVGLVAAEGGAEMGGAPAGFARIAPVLAADEDVIPALEIREGGPQLPPECADGLNAFRPAQRMHKLAHRIRMVGFPRIAALRQLAQEFMRPLFYFRNVH